MISSTSPIDAASSTMATTKIAQQGVASVLKVNVTVYYRRKAAKHEVKIIPLAVNAAKLAKGTPTVITLAILT